MDGAGAINADLAGRIHHGDSEAEATLCARFGPGVRQILARRLGNFAQAEELAQEVLIVVLKRLRATPLQDPSRLAAFVAQTARNLAMADRRKERRRRTDTGSEELDDVPDQEQDQSITVEVMSSAAAVHAMLKELKSSRDRVLLVRYYLQDEDKASICRDLGLSESTFNVVLFRARERLLELLQNRGMGRSELLACLPGVTVLLGMTLERLT
jgi:RNA polymerase sigma-70 factor (ECF subfamily)